MPRTDPVHDRGLVSWIEYESATRERNGSWKASATGRIRYQHDNGTSFTIETERKTAYGRSAEHAENGARSRVSKMLERAVAFVYTAQNPETT